MTTTKPIAEKKDMCLECKGKGEKPCSNPDHNFIMAISTAGGKSPSESQCPECGYTGISKCEECNGTGIKINTTPKPKAECKHNEIGQSYGFPMCLKCGTAWSSKDFIPTTPKPNGWEEIMHTYGEKYTKYANYQISDKEFEKANREILDLIHQAILSAEERAYKEAYSDATSIVLEPNHTYRRGRRDGILECIEALPKERNLNTKFPTFGVNRENESWIRGFNVAIDQATQNINNLDKSK